MHVCKQAIEIRKRREGGREGGREKRTLRHRAISASIGMRRKSSAFRIKDIKHHAIAPRTSFPLSALKRSVSAWEQEGGRTGGGKKRGVAGEMEKLTA